MSLSKQLPLSGIRILDFSTLLPGPYATQLLADMGAEVLRIEAVNRPDLLQSLPPHIAGVSAAHATINRGKQSLALNLKHPQAVEIIQKLLVNYDVVIEQFRPGVMNRLGLGYPQLREFQPQLIFCSITGYGQTGPLKDRAGHDINYLALSGLASYSGTRQTGPVLSGFQIADIAGGSHHAVMAIMAAVIQRQRTGEGQFLDISMSDAALALNCILAASTHAGAPPPSYGSDLLNGGSFYGYYKTADNRYLSVGSLEPQFLTRLLVVLSLEHWQEKLSGSSSTVLDAFSIAVAAIIAKHPLSYWQLKFADEDCCVEPVLNLKEAMEHEHFKARNMITEAVFNTGESICQVNTALPFKSEGPKSVGESLGKQSRQVLNSLGYTPAQIEQWQAEGIVSL